MTLRMTLRAVTVLLVLSSATAAQAQVEVTPPRPAEGWSAVRIAKWALLTAAIGFGTYALMQSSDADDHYAQLKRECQAEPSGCQMANGKYSDERMESLYQSAVSADRRARVGIIGGQVTLLGSVGLFVYDLRNGRGPDDIPYPRGAQIGVGLRMKF